MSNVEKAVVDTQEYRANRREPHNHDIHYVIRADFVEHVYKAYIQPPTEYWHDDLFDESNDGSDIFVESEDSDDENDIDENDNNDEVDAEDSDYEWCILFFLIEILIMFSRF